MFPPKTTFLSYLSGHSGAIYCLAAGRFRHTVFSGGADGFVAEWDLKTMQAAKFSVKLDSPVFAILLVPQTPWLVVGLFNGHIHVIDVNARKEIKHLSMKSKGVFTFCYDAQQQLLYSGGGDGIMNVWNINTWELVLSLPLTTQKIRNIKLSDDRLFVCCGDGNLKILENRFYNEIFSIQAHVGGVYNVLPQEHILYTVGKDAHLKIWDPKTGGLLESIPAHNFGIYGLLSWNNLLVTGSRDKTIKLWNPDDFQHPLRLDYKGSGGHQRSVNALHVCEWNNSLISCGDDGKIIVWKQE